LILLLLAEVIREPSGKTKLLKREFSKQQACSRFIAISSAANLAAIS
jgi:hypothetical protein